MAPSQFKEVEKLARKENRTLSELVREALRHYRQTRQQSRPLKSDLVTALREVQADARHAGLDKLTMREINTEVAAARREKRQRSH